jgi:cell division protein FtsB
MSSPFFLIVILIVFVVLARAAWGIHDKAVMSSTKLDQAQAEFAKLKSRESDLQNQVGRLSTDQGVEAEIRTKFKGVRVGESLAVIVSNDETASVGDSSTTEAVETVGWFKRLLQKIGL